MCPNSSNQTTLRDDIEVFMKRNFPQIQMHGGDFQIGNIDEETGTVYIYLSGTCDGCGISGMTVHAIQARMVEDLDPINSVDVTIGNPANKTTNTTTTTTSKPDDEDSSGSFNSNIPF